MLSTLGLNHVLAAVALSIAVLALWPWVVSPPLPTLRAQNATEAAKPSTLTALPPLLSFAAIGDRPLFSPSRRPAQTATPATTDAGIESRYRLIGLVATEATRRAWIAEGTRHFEIGEGDMLDGWKVVRVDRDQLLLSSPAGQATLTLRRAASDEKPTK
jgi:hypothetical protein